MLHIQTYYNSNFPLLKYASNVPCFMQVCAALKVVLRNEKAADKMECQQHPDNSLPAATSLIIQEGKNTNELLQKKGGLLFAHLLLMRALAWLYSDGMMMKNTNSFAFKSFPFSLLALFY